MASANFNLFESRLIPEGDNAVMRNYAYRLILQELIKANCLLPTETIKQFLLAHSYSTQTIDSLINELYRAEIVNLAGVEEPLIYLNYPYLMSLTSIAYELDVLIKFVQSRLTRAREYQVPYTKTQLYYDMHSSYHMAEAETDLVLANMQASQLLFIDKQGEIEQAFPHVAEV